MIYQTRYYAQYKEYEVQIQNNGFTGSSDLIYDLGPNPLQLSYNGNKGERNYIQGSSLTFSFYERPGEDYNELFESNYKDYKVLLINYDTSTLIWSGYVKPDNLSKSYLDYNKLIELNATDAIADLKDIDYENVSKRKPILQVIKESLDNTGIELPFQIQLHTWECNYMNPDDCALEKAYIDTRKFKKDNNGKTEYDDCYTVIEKALQPFSCNLKQINGAYRITNPNEIESSLFIYDFSTLSYLAEASSNNIINLNTYNFHTSSSKTKIRPLRAVDLTFTNKDVGGDLVNDVSNWSNTSVWKISAPGWSTTGEVLNLTLTSGQDASMALTNPFSVNYISGNEYMSLTFDYMADVFNPWHESTDGDEIYLRIWLKEAAGSWSLVDDTVISRSIFYQTYTSQLNANWKIPGDTTFQLFIEWTAPTNLTTAYVHIKNFNLTQANYVDGEITDAVTFDKNFYGDIIINKDKIEDTIYFGDSDAISEISAITIGNLSLSKNWFLYNESDVSTQIQDLYTKQLLRNNAKFRDYISIDIIDPSNTILPSTILQIGTKYFTITDYYKDYRDNYIKVSIDELLTQDTSYYVYTQIQLTSVDGVNQSSSTTVVPSIGDHGALTGLGDDDHPQYLNTSRGDARYPSLSYVDGSLARRDASLNNTINGLTVFLSDGCLNHSYFKWNSGLLEPSIASGSGDVTKLYVDGSLARRDTSINALFTRNIQQDASLNDTTYLLSLTCTSTYIDGSLNVKANIDASISYRTSAYTLTSFDDNRILEASGTFSVYLPTNLTVGFQTLIVNVGGGTISLNPSTGATFLARDSSNDLTKRYTGATVYYRGSNQWMALGDLK